MGVLDYVKVDIDALQANDDKIAQDFDAASAKISRKCRNGGGINR